MNHETLDQTVFNLKCSFKDCGWNGQPSGSQAQQYLSVHWRFSAETLTLLIP